MAFIPGMQENIGNYIPSTNIFDSTSLQEIDVNTDQFKDLLVKLHQHTNNIAMSSNNKISGYFLTTEFNSGGLLFNPNPAQQTQEQMRSIFRKVLTVIPLNPFPLVPTDLPPGPSLIPHGLAVTANWRFLHIYGMANNMPINSYPINSPFITAYIDPANVVINNTTAITFPSFYVVLEYCQF